MIPKWKLRREMLRLARQIQDLPGQIASVPQKLMWRRQLAAHDLDFDQRVQITTGDVPLGKKIAIFLIHQPTAIPQSVLLTLNYLIKTGYAPLIVINGKVPPDSIPELRRCAWLLLRRPNFGYDFGGYRDGLMVFRSRVADAERLIIMNDSVWFPISGDPIGHMEGHLDSNDLDAVGLNQDEKVRYQPDGSVKYELRHIESYFYLFSARFWKSDLFWQFWNKYLMSSDKRYTIKHGEIGFSKFVMARGARFSGLLRRSLFLDQIESCPVDFLRIALSYATYADTNYSLECSDLLSRYEDSEGWRKSAIKHIRDVALRRPFNISFCVAADHLFGTFYLKKNSQTYFHDMRQKYLHAVADGHIASPDPIIVAEIKTLVAKHDPRTAERTL